jgi:hypothetical protein
MGSNKRSTTVGQPRVAAKAKAKATAAPAPKRRAAAPASKSSPSHMLRPTTDENAPLQTVKQEPMTVSRTVMQQLHNVQITLDTSPSCDKLPPRQLSPSFDEMFGGVPESEVLAAAADSPVAPSLWDRMEMELECATTALTGIDNVDAAADMPSEATQPAQPNFQTHNPCCPKFSIVHASYMCTPIAHLTMFT